MSNESAVSTPHGDFTRRQTLARDARHGSHPTLRERVQGWYLRTRSRRLLGPFVRAGVVGLGLCVTVLGLVLVPLPGPGWAIVFLGLALTSVEFKPARRVLIFARGAVKGWTDWALRQPMWLRVLTTMAMVTFAIAIGFLTYKFGSALLA